MPHRHALDIDLDAAPARLHAALLDLRRWPDWDRDLRSVEHDGSRVGVGSTFALTPRGGPRVRMSVTAVDAPHLFEDEARLPFARMRTRHEFAPAGAGGARLRVLIETRGPLAFLWDRLVARKQAASAPEQARALAAFAKARAPAA